MKRVMYNNSEHYRDHPPVYKGPIWSEFSTHINQVWKNLTNLSCSLIMAVAMYDVKKCRSICCHKSLSERLVSQSPFGVVVVAANVVCCFIVVGFLLVGGLWCHQHNSRLADWSWYSRPVKYRDNDNCYRIRWTDYASHPLSHKEKKIQLKKRIDIFTYTRYISRIMI